MIDILLLIFDGKPLIINSYLPKFNNKALTIDSKLLIVNSKPLNCNRILPFYNKVLVYIDKTSPLEEGNHALAILFARIKCMIGFVLKSKVEFYKDH